MKTAEYPENTNLSDVMRHAHRNGWRIIRGRWTKDAFGNPIFQLMYLEKAK